MTGQSDGVRRMRAGPWLFVVALLLVAWVLRIGWLAEVPPGWRDDELINMHALSAEVLTGSFPLYFTGASGHEPLFHYVQAGVQAVLGINVLGGHLLPAALGLVSVALTYRLANCLLGRRAATVSSASLAASFWSLMYSRIGMRHVSVVLFAVLSIYHLWRGHEQAAKGPPMGARWQTYVWLGVAVGASMYTYFASRLLPAVLLGYLLYLAVFERRALRREWRGITMALVLAAAIVAPMAVAIARSVGVDPRIGELAGPMRSAVAGDVEPLLNAFVGTLGMFTTSGDPEWLYNLPGRPVMNIFGGVVLWAGVAACLVRWRRPERFIVLLWFVVGLAPAFVSVPPASLGHTILAQPVVYILAGLAVQEMGTVAGLAMERAGLTVRGARTYALVLSTAIAAVFVGTNAYRDLADYFVNWPRESLVRFLYRADYRDITRYLEGKYVIREAAVGSALMGPWDRLALEADSQRQVRYLLFNPGRALAWPGGGPSATAFLTDFPDLAAPFDAVVDVRAPADRIGTAASMHVLPDAAEAMVMICGARAPRQLGAEFANGLALVSMCWPEGPDRGSDIVLVTMWSVERALEMPPVPVVANPPPPGVYSGPRLAVFAHLVSGGDVPRLVDDGLWVDPLTLRVGDRFAQVHRFAPTDRRREGPVALEIGLYDPMTGERVPVLGVENAGRTDRLRVQLGGPE